MNKKWLVDLPWNEAENTLIRRNVKPPEGVDHYEIGEAREKRVDWVGVYAVIKT